MNDILNTHGPSSAKHGYKHTAVQMIDCDNKARVYTPIKHT